jgi:hypothetical protein
MPAIDPLLNRRATGSISQAATSRLPTVRYPRRRDCKVPADDIRRLAISPRRCRPSNFLPELLGFVTRKFDGV